jgi:hypothetical protein
MDAKSNLAIIESVRKRFMHLKYRVRVELAMSFSSLHYQAVGILDNIKVGNFKGVIFQIHAHNEHRRINKLFKKGKTVDEVLALEKARDNKKRKAV